ncbi:MAG: NAD(P)H-hydrate dehydratase [Polyangiaceae bacterium]
MIPVLSREQMRAFDREAIETCHVPGVVLMENAGRGAADVVSALIERAGTPAASREEMRSRAERARAFPTRHVAAPGQPASYPLHARVVVVCGAGNNGGDGYVVARHLLARGADVEVFLVGNSEKVHGDARIHHDAWIDLGGSLVELPDGSDLEPLRVALVQSSWVIDALFGTGLDRAIHGHIGDVIQAINAAPGRRVALDVPSGLDANTVAPLGVAVLADETVTFGHLKIGLLTPEGARLAGNVHVVDLGVPDRRILELVGHVAEVIRKETVGSYLRPREATVHKHKAGDVLVVAGSAGKLGAAWLTARSAIRAGAGLVTICTWPEAATGLEARVVEIMTARIEPESIAASLDRALANRHAVAIGPGLGLDERARVAVDHVVLGWKGFKVVDADAITHFVGRAEALSGAVGQTVLTPHPGELGRLLGRSGRDVEQDRFGAVREAVRITRCTVVLKGARTIIAHPDGRIFVSMAGNPALATAGAGDVLTGLIAALSCSMGGEEAAAAGVLVHGLAGDRWRAQTGCDRGLLASEIPDLFPGLLAALQRGDDPLA